MNEKNENICLSIISIVIGGLLYTYTTYHKRVALFLLTFIVALVFVYFLVGLINKNYPLDSAVYDKKSMLTLSILMIITIIGAYSYDHYFVMDKKIGRNLYISQFANKKVKNENYDINAIKNIVEDNFKIQDKKVTISDIQIEGNENPYYDVFVLEDTIKFGRIIQYGYYVQIDKKDGKLLKIINDSNKYIEANKN